MDKSTIEKVKQTGMAKAQEAARQSQGKWNKRQERAERKANRIETFETLDDRNRAIGARAESIIQSLPTIIESRTSDKIAYFALSKPTETEEGWVMGRLKKSHFPYGLQTHHYDLGVSLIDSGYAEALLEGKVDVLDVSTLPSWGETEETTYEVLNWGIMDKESARARNYIPNKAASWSSERPFSPIGAVGRLLSFRRIDDRLASLEETMDLFESALADSELNPQAATEHNEIIAA